MQDKLIELFKLIGTEVVTKDNKARILDGIYLFNNSYYAILDNGKPTIYCPVNHLKVWDSLGIKEEEIE